MTTEMDKSLEELKAVVEEDIAKLAEEGKSETEEASDTDSEGTSKVADGSSDTEEDNSSPEEWVVPGRFKTKDDLLEGYKNLESEYGRRSSEFKKLQNEVSQVHRTESPEQKESRLRRFADKVQEDPERAVAEIAHNAMQGVEEKLKQKEFENIYYERKKNPEFNELEPIMSQIAIAYGDIIKDNGLANDPRVLDILEMAARGVRAATKIEEAGRTGKKKGEDIHRKKTKARVEGTSGTTTPKKKDTSKMTSAEMKQAILKGEIEL